MLALDGGLGVSDINIRIAFIDIYMTHRNGEWWGYVSCVSYLCISKIFF